MKILEYAITTTYTHKDKNKSQTRVFINVKTKMTNLITPIAQTDKKKLLKIYNSKQKNIHGFLG